MAKSTNLINQEKKTGYLSQYLSETRDIFRFVVYYALFYGLLRLLEFGAFKLFVSGGLPQALSYVSFLIAVTTGIMSQLLLDFALFIVLSVLVVAIIYSIRLGAKWFLSRSDTAVDSIPSPPGPATIYGTDPAVTFGERIERTETKRKIKRNKRNK